jgi:hypothetical protein
MKPLARSLGAACAVLMLAGVQNASAQITGSVEFTTSFPFTVGNATVPAGSYTIAPDFDAPSIFQLTGAHTAVLFQTDTAQAPTTPSGTEVVFKRYGDGYVLKDIWMEGNSVGAESQAAEAEKHMATHPDAVSERRLAATRSTKTSAKR